MCELFTHKWEWISSYNLLQMAACIDMMKWKQSCTLWSKSLLSSISILNSRSRASCTNTQVLMSMLSFSEFQLVLKVTGTPSHLSGSACLKRSPTHLMMRLANTVGYKLRVRRAIEYLLIKMMMVGIWVVEGADHHWSQCLVILIHKNELPCEEILLEHHFVHHFYRLYLL